MTMADFLMVLVWSTIIQQIGVSEMKICSYVFKQNEEKFSLMFTRVENHLIIVIKSNICKLALCSGWPPSNVILDFF